MAKKIRNFPPQTYGDLDLIELRKKLDLDFAHFTYLPRQCSCCYGPYDLPARYWKNNIIPESRGPIDFILFKNACNGSGWVRRTTSLRDYECISWNLRSDPKYGEPLTEQEMERLDEICQELSRVYGPDWYVQVPASSSVCIIIQKIPSPTDDPFRRYKKLDESEYKRYQPYVFILGKRVYDFIERFREENREFIKDWESGADDKD